MTIAGTSLESKALTSAIDIIASTDAFTDRLALYAPSVVNPADRIFVYEASSDTLDQPLADLRPFIVVAPSEDIAYVANSPGNVNPNLLLEGGIYVVIIDDARLTDVGGSDAQGDSTIDFFNFVGELKEQSSLFFGTATDLIGFDEIQTVEPPTRTGITERINDDFWAAVFNFKFGQ